MSKAVISYNRKDQFIGLVMQYKMLESLK